MNFVLSQCIQKVLPEVKMVPLDSVALGDTLVSYSWMVNHAALSVW